MRLYEEYLKRHNLEIPIVHHFSTGSILLKSQDSFLGSHKWIFMFWTWVDNPRCPGHYDIRIRLPIRNGFQKQRRDQTFVDACFNSSQSVIKRWDEYEDFFYEWLPTLKFVYPVKKTKSLILDAFEMFVFIFDDWFNLQPQKVKRILFEVLDKENSLQTRYDNFCDLIAYLKNHQEIFSVWKKEISDYLPSYSEWLINLIENECKKNMPQSKLLTQ